MHTFRRIPEKFFLRSNTIRVAQDLLGKLLVVPATDGQRVSAVRFGEPRVQALFGALCHFSHLPNGFRNHDLRPLVAALLGRAQSSYALVR